MSVEVSEWCRILRRLVQLQENVGAVVCLFHVSVGAMASGQRFCCVREFSDNATRSSEPTEHMRMRVLAPRTMLTEVEREGRVQSIVVAYLASLFLGSSGGRAACSVCVVARSDLWRIKDAAFDGIGFLSCRYCSHYSLPAGVSVNSSSTIEGFVSC